MNNRVRNLSVQILSDNWYILKKAAYEYLKKDGTWQQQTREAYDRGNGAAVLLYNKEQQTVILTRQFRMPAYLNGNEDGMLIEVCAGLLDKDNPEDCVKREAEEETGFIISQVKKVFETYMSPGSVTEILYLFVAEYSNAMRGSDGGGLEQEQEEIEVMEIPFVKALDMIASGEIKDAKTVMLLQYAQIHQLL